VRVLIKGLLALFLVLTVLWLLSAAVVKTRDAATLTECANNLHQIGMALQLYDDTHHRFPQGTVPNTNLPPDRRLSWTVEICPAYIEGGYRLLLDRTKAWDAPENCPPRCRIKEKDEEELFGEVKVFVCPASPVPFTPHLPNLTHYRGIAGVGEDAAELPLSDRRAGFFGYDRKVTRDDIKDGTSATIAVVEVPDGEPWTAGGRATVQGLATGGPPYLSEGGQFSTNHGRHRFPFPNTRTTSVLFADGSVRPFTAAVSPRVFEALATIAGREEIDGFEH
jgi:hypothetical protein